MKLAIDFSILSNAVSQMGAELIDFSSSVKLGALEPLDIELDDGLEVEFTDIEFETGLASYKGRQVLLYIKDHGGGVVQALYDGSKGRKYHIADCGTLAGMRASGKYDRYVVTNKLTGLFLIAGNDWATAQHIEGQAHLKVCKNCLAHLNYQGYLNKPKNRIFKAFNLNDFFDTYSSFFKFMPSGVTNNKNIGYSEDWPNISKKVRQRFYYQCQQCSLDLSSHKSLLHVHHINSVKSDNSDSNLTPLCADCHRKQPNHQHMFVKHEDTKLITNLRRNQGLIVKEKWQDIYDLADPGLHGVIDRLENYQISLPEVGEEILNDRREVITELELAWPLKKVGVAVDKASAVEAKKQGWKVFSMRNALSQFDDLASRLR